MIWILVFLFVYMGLSFWDVRNINRLFSRTVNPGRRKPEVELPPAPRLVIDYPPKAEGPPDV